MKELRVGTGADQTLCEGRELRRNMNGDLQHRDRAKRAEFVSLYLSDADTTGGVAERPEHLFADGRRSRQIARRHKWINGLDAATILAEEPDDHTLLRRVHIKKPSLESSRGAGGFQGLSFSVAMCRPVSVVQLTSTAASPQTESHAQNRHRPTHGDEQRQTTHRAPADPHTAMHAGSGSTSRFPAEPIA